MTTEPKNTELMPCPFCGQQDAFVEQLDSDASVVICQGLVGEHAACLARGPVGLREHEVEDQPGRNAAIREWNRRAQAADQQGEQVCDICNGKRRLKEPGCDEGDCTACLVAQTIDLSAFLSVPTEYAILFDTTKYQVDTMLAKHPYVLIFTFVTVSASEAPDMNWIDGYQRVVRPLHLGNFEEADREPIAQRYVRANLTSEKLVQVMPS